MIKITNSAVRAITLILKELDTDSTDPFSRNLLDNTTFHIDSQVDQHLSIIISRESMRSIYCITGDSVTIIHSGLEDYLQSPDESKVILAVNHMQIISDLDSRISHLIRTVKPLVAAAEGQFEFLNSLSMKPSDLGTLRIGVIQFLNELLVVTLMNYKDRDVEPLLCLLPPIFRELYLSKITTGVRLPSKIS